MTVCVGNRCGLVSTASYKGLPLFLALVLSACGGGGDGGNITIAEGQGTDPVVVDVPIAYVKRPAPVDEMGDPLVADARELLIFDEGTIGADLIVRERASPTAAEINVTEDILQGMGDVRDVEASYDGERFVFAMRGPFDPNLDEEEQPTWNIWEYEIATDSLRRIITSDIQAEEGHDLAPHYLPDGRIIFSSTRQRLSVATLLDEGKEQFAALDEGGNEPAFVLHVINPDGSDVRQVSFNQSHDFDPTVTSDGKVVFSRWDNAGPEGIHLYRMNPDGSELELLYGANSHDTGTNGAEIQFLQPREMPDGRILTLARPFETDVLGGDLVQIDTANYLENTQPIAPNAGVLSGPAQSSAVINDVRTDGTISPGGTFGAAFPLLDGTDRLFVSWSQCRLLEDGQAVPCTPSRLADPNAVAAPPAYGIWMYDLGENTQLPIVPAEQGAVYSEIIAAQPRTAPPIILDLDAAGLADPALVADTAGVINIRSVYDIDGVDTAVPDIPTMANPTVLPPDQSPAMFLRITKAVGIPDEDILDFDDSAFGRADVMREILGYVPIQPDGSVLARVPANLPLQISILDRRGQRIGPRHNNWLQLRPGQTLTCNGCHNPASGVSHGRSNAFDSAYAGSQNPTGPFPGANPAYFTELGETMAETRARISCALDCADVIPSVDLNFVDVWTDPAVPDNVAAAFSYRYTDLDPALPSPVSEACETAWSWERNALCRAVINYEEVIQPLWDLPRLADDGITDVTCVTCHTRFDDMNNQRVPDGQLDLRGVPSVEEINHFVSFRELVFPDNLEFFDETLGIVTDVLVDVEIEVIDPDTGELTVIVVQEPVSIGSPAVAGSARASGGFFTPFEPGNTHEGWLSDAELRLVSEWLDIGAQYFNNPFDAPIDD
jgi:hypothetical protein